LIYCCVVVDERHHDVCVALCSSNEQRGVAVSLQDSIQQAGKQEAH
jgi:hypothetical protein